MKKLLITIILMLTAFCVNAQWVQQYPVTINIHLQDVKFVNSNTGWTSGVGGIILKTTNGGNIWLEQNSGIVGKYLTSISTVNANVVYMVGFFETIIKTTNGGNNWTIIRNGPYGTGHSYEGGFFINENTGWICGSGSLIFKTTNGGVSFDSVSIPVGYLYDIYFRNENEGLVCGEAATIYKTTNGGLNWQEITVPVGNEAANFNRLSVINDSIVYTQGVQNNKIYKSYNFGNTWDSVARVFGADDSYTLCFPNEMTGWCAGTYGLMFKTTNGGYNWQPEIVPQTNQAYIRALYFINRNTGWAVGGATKIFYTSNGGATFITSESEIISGFKLNQNYPNPFNASTIISFDIIKSGDYKLEIFNSLGQVIEKYSYPSQKQGSRKLSFNGSKLSSGIYFYRLTGTNNSITKTMVLIK